MGVEVEDDDEFVETVEDLFVFAVEEDIPDELQTHYLTFSYSNDSYDSGELYAVDFVL
jgi:hypothetical protein